MISKFCLNLFSKLQDMFQGNHVRVKLFYWHEFEVCVILILWEEEWTWSPFYLNITIISLFSTSLDRNRTFFLSILFHNKNYTSNYTRNKERRCMSCITWGIYFGNFLWHSESPLTLFSLLSHSFLLSCVTKAPALAHLVSQSRPLMLLAFGSFCLCNQPPSHTLS